MKKTIDEQTRGVMAGAGCTQRANGEWVAKTGPMSTLRGTAKTKDAAIEALRKKVAGTISKSAKK